MNLILVLVARGQPLGHVRSCLGSAGFANQEVALNARRGTFSLLAYHEQMLIVAAAEGRSDRDLMTWWANGGEQTLDSYGVNDPSSLPDPHLEWIKALPLRFADQKRLFVHAGIRPGVAIADQSENDLLWIREPFLSSKASYTTFVVHGHTPTESGLPDLRSHRLNLDTGACFGGELTAAAFTNQTARPMFFVNSRGAVWQP